MNSLISENRVSLSRKSEDLFKIVEELSSSYTKREKFAFANALEVQKYTSEVCTFFILCAYVSYVGAVALGVAVVAGYLACGFDIWDCSGGGEYAMVDSMTYKNVV